MGVTVASGNTKLLQGIVTMTRVPELVFSSRNTPPNSLARCRIALIPTPMVHKITPLPAVSGFQLQTLLTGETWYRLRALAEYHPRRRTIAPQGGRPMSMRRFVFPVLCAVAFGVSAAAFAQESENALPPVAPSTGKFVFTFTVTVSSTVPNHGVVACTAFANVNESSGQNIQQMASGIATPSGGKATCTVNMPDSWALATPASDKVILSYKVELIHGDQITA